MAKITLENYLKKSFFENLKSKKYRYGDECELLRLSEPIKEHFSKVIKLNN